MTLERWNDERIDDLKQRVDILEPVARRTVEHEVTLEEHTRALSAVNTSQVDLGKQLNAMSSSNRWTPAALGPIIIAIITVVGVILTKGGS